VSRAARRALVDVASFSHELAASSHAERGFRGEENRRTRGRARVVELDGFAAEAIEQQADRFAMEVEDLIGFAVLYYLADVDSGRIARTVPRRDAHLEN
jgi:hypothetical protein